MRRHLTAAEHRHALRNTESAPCSKHSNAGPSASCSGVASVPGNCVPIEHVVQQWADSLSNLFHIDKDWSSRCPRRIAYRFARRIASLWALRSCSRRGIQRAATVREYRISSIMATRTATLQGSASTSNVSFQAPREPSPIPVRDANPTDLVIAVDHGRARRPIGAAVVRTERDRRLTTAVLIIAGNCLQVGKR